MITIHKFIKNGKICTFKTTETKVITSIVTNDKFIINPTLEQFLESGWQLYVESEHKQSIINNAEEVQTVETTEEQNDTEETNEVIEENNEAVEENNYSPVEGENNENQEQVVEEIIEEPVEEPVEEVNNENNSEEIVQTEETVNEE